MSLKVLVYFSPETLSNSYILCDTQGGKAVIIDPRVFDIPLGESAQPAKAERTNQLQAFRLTK